MKQVNGVKRDQEAAGTKRSSQLELGRLKQKNGGKGLVIWLRRSLSGLSFLGVVVYPIRAVCRTKYRAYGSLW